MGTSGEQRIQFLRHQREEFVQLWKRLHAGLDEMIKPQELQAELALFARDFNNLPVAFKQDPMITRSDNYQMALTLAPNYLRVKLNQEWGIKAKREALENISHAVDAIDRLLALEQRVKKAA